MISAAVAETTSAAVPSDRLLHQPQGRDPSDTLTQRSSVPQKQGRHRLRLPQRRSNAEHAAHTAIPTTPRPTSIPGAGLSEELC